MPDAGSRRPEPRRGGQYRTEGYVMARKQTWKDKIGKSTFDKPELNKRALELKRSFDEISSLLEGLDKTKKNK